MQASFEGQLERVETPDLLTFINQARRTGLLEMERTSQSTRIFFLHGEPVFASSNRPGLRLGDLLLRVGKISARDLERCAQHPRAAGDRMGQLLVAEKLLTEAELRSFLKVQISEVIFNSLFWGEGRFAFYDDVAHPRDVITIDMNLQNLIMEGVRRIDERGQLGQQFPDLEMLVESLTNPDWVKSHMSLTPEEWSVFFLVDGRRSLQEICELAGHADALTTLEILNRLRETNLIGLVSADRRAPPEPKVAPAVVPTLTTPPLSETALLSSPPPEPVPAPAERLPYEEDETLSILSASAARYVAAGRPTARLVIEDSIPPAVYQLQGDAYTLGRGPKNDIVVNDLNVSTFHCRVERGAGGFKVYDLKSTNGTAINKQRLHEPAVLKPNDVLNLGPVRLLYLED
ncbi:MAG: DUF4388 domain-containing protein [Vicinamibacteria bacterium]|nr:DUF4388 domain-containing protein [Vicinamibacteria bacterium]